jgi:hypothetical protein
MTEKEELEYYRNLSRDLNSDPEIAMEFGKVLKKVRPDVKNPQTEFLEKSDAKLKSEFEKRDKELEELKKEILSKKAEDKLQRDRQILRSGKFNLDDAQIDEVEKWMAEKGVIDYEAAGEVYLARHQVAPANRFTGLRNRPREAEPDKLTKVNETARKIFRKRTRDNGAFDKAYEEALHLFDK